VNYRIIFFACYLATANAAAAPATHTWWSPWSKTGGNRHFDLGKDTDDAYTCREAPLSPAEAVEAINRDDYLSAQIDDRGGAVGVTTTVMINHKTLIWTDWYFRTREACEQALTAAARKLDPYR
jgi:hypothetical protein